MANSKDTSTNTPPDGMIHGVLVPCTEFLGDEGLSEEKEKELWTEVVADNSSLQEWVEWDINFKGTVQNDIYRFLNKHNSGKVYIKNGNITYKKEN